MPLGKTIAAVTGVALGACGVLGYTVVRVQGRANGDVGDYLARPRGTDRPVVVAGASIVRGKASVDFVQILRERFLSRTFVNAGVNGNIAWELLQRIEDVLACEPSHVVILVGTNDVQATLSPAAADRVRRSKRLPVVPSLEWYAGCLRQITERLQSNGARVALCSLPPIGQDLDAQVNAVVRQANSAIAEVCDSTGAAYLPVYEHLARHLVEAGEVSGPPWTGSWVPGLASLVQHFVLGRNYDSIARGRGWLLSPDGVHMDSTGAAIIAEVVGEWLA